MAQAEPGSVGKSHESKPHQRVGLDGVVSFGGRIYPTDEVSAGKSRRASPYVPSVLPLQDGQLLLVSGEWRGGSFKGVPDGGTYGITSPDAGETWSDPFPLKIKGGGYVKGGHCSLLRLQSGAVGLINFDSFYRSEDEGKTWIGPVAIGPRKWGDHVRNDCAVVLKSGRILAPAYMYPPRANAPGKENAELNFGIARYSDDEGRTWGESKTVLAVPLDGGRKGLYMWDEWSVVELEGGHLLGMARTEMNRLYQCVSKDQGETWEDVEPTELASGDSPCLVRCIPTTGDLLVIWNQTSAQEYQRYLTRHRLSCAISRDQGKTWDNFKNLESLDDVTRIELSQIRPYRAEPQLFPEAALGYHQPEDRKRYHKAPGALRVASPTCTFLDDKVVITCGYGCIDDPVGDVACKIRVIPVEWFYE